MIIYFFFDCLYLATGDHDMEFLEIYHLHSYV